MINELSSVHKSFTWLVTVAATLVVSIFIYIWYPVNHENKVTEFQKMLPALKETQIDWFSTDTCNVLIYSEGNYNTDLRGTCSIKGVAPSFSSFREQDTELHLEVKKILRGQAEQVGLSYDEEGGIVWAQFASKERFGMKLYYYVFSPDYTLPSTQSDSILSGNRVPINHDWYYIDAN